MRIRRGAHSSSEPSADRKVSLFKAGTIFAALVVVSAGFLTSGAAPQREQVPSAKPVQVLGEKLVAATSCPTGHFCMTGDVDGLVPGTETPWTLTLINPNPFPIYVTQLSATAGTSLSGGCNGPDNLTVTGFQASGSGDIPADAITIGPSSSTAPGAATTTLDVAMNDLPLTPQDSCLGVTFPVTSTGNAVWYGNCITGKQAAVTVAAGQTVCLTTPASVSGGISVQSGGTLIVNPGTSITGGIKSSGGALKINICGAKVTGGVAISGSAGPVWIGAAKFCPSNSISGGVTLTNNTGDLQVVGNKITGGISCSGNNPAPSDAGSPNAVSGRRTGQCAGGF